MSRLADSYYEWRETLESRTSDLQASDLLARAANATVNALAISNTLLLELADKDVADAIASLLKWQEQRKELRSRFGGVA